MTTNLELLHYDANPQAVLSPRVDGEFAIPSKVLYLLTDDAHFQPFIKRYHGVELGSFDTITKVSRVYQIDYHGTTLGVAQAPLGAPAAVMLLEALIEFGGHQIMSMGSCGALTALPEGQLLLPVAALRDEGTSFHYLPAADWVTLNAKMQVQLATTLTAADLKFEVVKTWTTDAMFRETAAKIATVKQQGCQVVEMECAALAACAEFRQVAFGQLLFTADSLAELSAYDPRHWGADAIATAIELTAQSLIA